MRIEIASEEDIERTRSMYKTGLPPREKFNGTYQYPGDVIKIYGHIGGINDIVETIVHESMHRILEEEQGLGACLSYDNLGGCFAKGRKPALIFKMIEEGIIQVKSPRERLMKQASLKKDRVIILILLMLLMVILMVLM